MLTIQQRLMLTDMYVDGAYQGDSIVYMLDEIMKYFNLTGYELERIVVN